MRLLKACRSNPGYVRGEAWPLLRTMLVRLAADRRRTAGRELRRLAGAYERPSPGIWETDLEVVEALLSLPPRMRACVVLHYGEDYRWLRLPARWAQPPQPWPRNCRSRAGGCASAWRSRRQGP